MIVISFHIYQANNLSADFNLYADLTIFLQKFVLTLWLIHLISFININIALAPVGIRDHLF